MYSKLSLAEIAAVIRKDWSKVHHKARPFLDAMSFLYDTNDTYGFMSAKHIIKEFIYNGNSWRGEIARAVKKELRKRSK